MGTSPFGFIGDLVDKIKKNRTYKIIAIVFALAVIILMLSLVTKNFSSLKKGNTKSTTESVGTTAVIETTTEPTESETTTEPAVEITESQAESIAQSVFDDAYEILKDGTGFANWDYTGEIKYNEKKVKAYSVNMNSIEPYFTEKCLKFIGDRFTDTPDADKAIDVYGNKGSYYIFANGKSHASSFSDTIFALTDHEKADLQIILYDDNTILAKNDMYTYGSYQSEDNIERVEYLVLVKEDDTWKIDSFEDYSVTVNTLSETTEKTTTK